MTEKDLQNEEAPEEKVKGAEEVSKEAAVEGASEEETEDEEVEKKALTGWPKRIADAVEKTKTIAAKAAKAADAKS